MKSALCLLGQPRTMEYCFPSQKKHILDVYNPDVFIVSDEGRGRMTELYNPVAIEIHAQEKIWQEIGERRTSYVSHSPETKPESDMSVLWKAWRGGELLKEYESLHGIYDLVFISRFDVKFLRVPVITEIKENTLYVPQVNAYLSPPDSKGNHYGGYSAQLCWGSSAVAKLMMNMYNLSGQYYQEAGKWHSEKMLKWTFDRAGIAVQHVDISMMIIRGTSDAPLAFDYRPLAEYPEFI